MSGTNQVHPIFQPLIDAIAPKPAQPAHTPGPWHVDRDAPNTLTVRTAEACTVARIEPRASMEHIPTAKLIGAAPDLAEALRLTESNLSRLVAAKHSDEVLMSPWLEVVRATLAKAGL